MSLVSGGASDAGVRVVTVTLGGPHTAVTGEPWPIDGKGRVGSTREVKGPVEGVLRLPSGREYRAVTRSMVVNLTDDAKAVRSVYFDLGTAPTWPEIIEVAQGPLVALGVSSEERAASKAKVLAMSPPAFPSYPLEPCVSVTTTMRPKRAVGFYLSLEFTLWPPGSYQPKGAPACPPLTKPGP